MATAVPDLSHSSDAPLQRGLTPDVIPNDRESAYYHWAHVSGQNAAETARAIGLAPRTVQEWAQQDGWRTRYDYERGQLAERVRNAVESALFRAMPGAIAALARIAEGEGDTRQHVTKDGDVVEVVEFVPYMARVNAIRELRSMFEGPPVHHHHHTADVPATPAPVAPSPPTSPNPAIPDPAGPITREQALAMTPAERQAWEEARRRLRQAG